MKKVSIIIPVYNEEKTIIQILKKINLEKKKIKEKDADTVILEKELSLKLGVKLTINDKNNKGNIKIEYRNIDQRENIIKKLIGE